jgi:hypothetical protein
MEHEKQIVAISGSPNSITEVSVDVMQDHLSRPLVGALLELEMDVRAFDDKIVNIVVLGQVTEVITTNRWHENPSLKNFIKRRGKLPNLTGVGDVTTAKIQIVGTYVKTDNKYKKERMTVPPGSGIPLLVVEQQTIHDIMRDEIGIGYVGKILGPGDLPAPATLKHFGDSVDGGTGEAYMGGFFGPPGSGKTVMAAVFDALWARNDEMGLLILDPQGEFAENKIARGSGFEFDFHTMLRTTTNGRFDPANDCINISDIKLEGFGLFAALLERDRLFQLIGLGSGKIADAVVAVEDALEVLVEPASHCEWRIGDSLTRTAEFQEQYDKVKAAVVNACGNVYASGSRTAKIREFGDSWDNNRAQIHGIWDAVAERFAERDEHGNEKQDLVRIIRSVMEDGRKLILDLSPSRLGIEDKYKLHLMHFAMKRISQAAQIAYKQNGNVNCLIVLDEAGRFIPESSKDDEKSSMAKYITERVKEMRKFRVGWQFITQTVTEIQKDIYRSLHYRVYGVGLGVGSEEQYIKDMEGKEAFAMYATLPEPRLSGIYSHMMCGNIIALGTTGNPMYIEGFHSDQETMERNGLATEFADYKVTAAPPQAAPGNIPNPRNIEGTR